MGANKFLMPRQLLSPLLDSTSRSLRHARCTRGLTQRPLGDRVRLPRTHVSKIEQGVVDLQLSNLAELARALDLEVRLVPRPLLPAVEDD